MFEDIMELVVVFLIIFGVVFGGIGLVADTQSRYVCNNYQKITGTNTKYITLDSCYIETASGWQRWDEYKARATASEGLK